MAPNLDRIKAFAFDVDGVMTGGEIICESSGDFLRVYDAKDGLAIRMATMNGYPVGVITGGSSDTIRIRFIASGVKPENIFLHSRDKMDDFKLFLQRNSLKGDEVMYFGDDLPDLEVMQACGLSMAPSDAVPEVLEAADIVSAHRGGKGCIREGMEMIMKAQGRWIFDTPKYKTLF